MGSKTYFDNIAGEWDKIRLAFFGEKLRDKALRTASVRPGQKAADIGAGTGFMTEGLLACGLEVIAVDQSEAMLEVMKRKFPGHPALDLRVAESASLPVADRSVDFAFANMFLHHVENPALAIAEMVRILKPTGRLVITDLDEHRFEALREEQQDRWLGFRRPDVDAWLKAAGLKDTRVECALEDCCTKSACGETIRISIFIASGEKPGPGEDTSLL